MKITIDIDCSPAEARAFLGLPDIAPLQAELVDKLRERMLAGLDSMTQEALLKTWLPTGMQGIEELQRMFWGQGRAAAKDRTGP